MHRSHFRGISLFAVVAALILAVPAFAQEGKLKVRVSPKQAYVFVDGNAIRHGSQAIRLAAGKHSVGVYNYGYTPSTQDVEITAGKTANLSVTLQPAGGSVSGPFGEIELKGPRPAAVLLTGKTPAYFVGHVDEFDWNWLWHQELLVPPGTHQVTVTRNGQTVWSGPVTVKAGQRVTVDVNHNGAMKTSNWKPGNTLGAQPRFKAGLASSRVVIAPVSGTFSAAPAQVNCGDSSKLAWSSTDAVESNISGMGNVAPSGGQSVTPTKTTTYDFTASGPGGTASSSATVNVNSTIPASLSVNPAEARYRRIGDKVVEQGSSTVTWSTSNASTVTLDPFGSVSASGSKTVQAQPKQTANGPVDENVTYTLNASNVCGGTATQTATLHIVGSIEPIPAVALSSVFYPTAYPERRHPEAGLVSSQQQSLSQLAATFKKYLEYDPSATLEVVGHADARGPARYNQALSQRRADRVKDYLVSQGIAADKIQAQAQGKEKQLNVNEVKQLQSDNPAKPEKWMLHRVRNTWLAYNRRVDIVLEPSGKESTRYYPNAASEARILWQPSRPSLKAVEKAE